KVMRAMTPALLTAFSTASSSGTLPVTLDRVENHVGVSNKVSSFVLPIGATVNMDGTALYECIAVIFVSQLYAAANPDFTLTFANQLMIVFLALMVSIGAAGIPHAGLVMMVIIFKAIGVPIELAGVLWAVDRPLDMCRTTVNIWSDTMGATAIAHHENEIDEGVLFRPAA
ncbi:MAG: cation:dicarboxylase symporter family transporter, partial [Acidobacteria bacterium]|nr:cation:dicarboxylase symporter family transporter [Acidobacteriota bacterium]NIM63201.1 cation:dicarboxylase symporter family transporter [Acidobacteriota bacterium]NIO60033.1 cation:dicarboxylase symporter family transporter [Acidobacteriota bacterium]NIQ31132.1 cation:dicarboxylase symporter family transporter [Acidobacteriota bacterium]NIQ86209.1 cation:dicarboxylase symporter family transporter [Acidobacteriota bacterium]